MPVACTNVKTKSEGKVSPQLAQVAGVCAFAGPRLTMLAVRTPCGPDGWPRCDAEPWGAWNWVQ